MSVLIARASDGHIAVSPCSANSRETFALGCWPKSPSKKNWTMFNETKKVTIITGSIVLVCAAINTNLKTKVNNGTLCSCCARIIYLFCSNRKINNYFGHLSILIYWGPVPQQKIEWNVSWLSIVSTAKTKPHERPNANSFAWNVWMSRTKIVNKCHYEYERQRTQQKVISTTSGERAALLCETENACIATYHCCYCVFLFLVVVQMAGSNLMCAWKWFGNQHSSTWNNKWPRAPHNQLGDA